MPAQSFGSNDATAPGLPQTNNVISTLARVSARVSGRVPRLPTLLLAGDLVGVAIAVVLSASPTPQALTFGSFLIVALGLNQLYKSRLHLSVLDDLPKLGTAWLVASAAVLGLNDISHIPRGNTGALVVLGGAALIGLRSLSHGLARRVRAAGLVAHNTVVIGTTQSGQRLANILIERPEYGLRPVGFLGEHDEARPGLSVPVIGAVNDLAAVIYNEGVHVAILAYEDVPDHDLVTLLRSCHRLRCELFLIPHFAEMHSVNEDTELIWGVPLVRLRRAAHRTWSWQFKRLTDVLVAGLAVFLLLPVLAALAYAVRREGGPGVIFKQIRVGIDGREFELWKFRSMKPVDDTESATNWNIAQDDRVGPVGRFIRKTSLDELPQLVNILRGDMSLVGPRPERPHFVRQFSDLYPSYQSRDRVPCGLTGWAQVHGLRGDTPVDERADFDNFYIENWSLWLDVKIMLKTLVSVVKAPGA